MDEQHFERDLRDGLAVLLDPVLERHPRWETSPAARQVVATPASHGLSGRFGMLWAAALLGLLLVALLAATVFVGARRPDQAVVIAPSPTPPAACPAGSTPDEPGPVDQARPPASEYLGPMVWDRTAGRMVLLATETWADFARRGDTIYGTRGQVTWTFDVCTNRWHKGRLVTALPDYAPGPLVYDEDSDATLLIAWDSVWAYDVATDTWARRGDGPPDGDLGSALYDPVSGLVLVSGGPPDAIRTYDVDTDTWGTVSQGGSIPPPQGNSGFEFVSYDRSADRLVVYRDSGTWLFDPRARWWTKVSTSVPISFFIGFDGMVYDEAGEQTLIYGQGSVAAFDARTMKWEYLYGTGTRVEGADFFDRGAGWATAYDPLNQRLVVIGGSVWSQAIDGWQPTDDVIAFDPRTRSWTELLAPSSGGS